MGSVEHQILQAENHIYSSGVSKVIDVSHVVRINLTCRVIKTAGTNPMLDLIVQHSLNGVNWQEVHRDFRQGVFRRFTTTGVQTITLTAFSRYIRLKWVISGTSAMFNFRVDGAFRKEQIQGLGTKNGVLYYGLRSEGEHYRLANGVNWWPGLNLLLSCNPNASFSTSAWFSALASNKAEIAKITTSAQPIAYYNLFCGMMHLKDVEIFREIINDRENRPISLAIKTGQSDGSKCICLCNDEPRQHSPHWSHVTSESLIHSGTPRDIARFYSEESEHSSCCHDDVGFLFEPAPGSWVPNTRKIQNVQTDVNLDYLKSTQQEPSVIESPPPDQWSQNIYNFTRTLLTKFAQVKESGLNFNTIFSFENEVASHWAGLGDPYTENDGGKCVPDIIDFINIDENTALRYGRHLANHYMQAYFSFTNAIKDWNEKNDQSLKSFPFGISSPSLGMLVTRWIAGDQGDPLEEEEARRFANIYYAEYTKDFLNQAMREAYGGPNGTWEKPWPETPDGIQAWKYDFAIGHEHFEDKVSRKTISAAEFMKHLFDYIKKDVVLERPHFSGLMIHFYEHWSCIPKVLEYLNWLRSDHLEIAVDNFPVLVNELGNRLRWIGRGDPGYKCDKTIDYETGTRFDKDPVEIINEQACETSRKLLMFSAPSVGPTVHNIGSIEWMHAMKPPDSVTDKCGIIQECGRRPTLPGKRFQALNAYRFFMQIINNGFSIQSHKWFEVPPNVAYRRIVFKNHDNLFITAFWCFEYSEDPPSDIGIYNEAVIIEELSVPYPQSGELYSGEITMYSAAGEHLKNESFIVEDVEDVDVDCDTSPKFLVWGDPYVLDFEEELTGFENYSKLLVFNTKINQVQKYTFDVDDNVLSDALEDRFTLGFPETEGEYSLQNTNSFAWMPNGHFVVADNKIRPEVQPATNFESISSGIEMGHRVSELLHFASLSGRFIGKALICDEEENEIIINEIKSIAIREEEVVVLNGVEEDKIVNTILYMAAKIGVKYFIYRFKFQANNWIQDGGPVDLEDWVPLHIRFCQEKASSNEHILVSCYDDSKSVTKSVIISVEGTAVEQYTEIFYDVEFRGFDILRGELVVAACKYKDSKDHKIHICRILEDSELPYPWLEGEDQQFPLAKNAEPYSLRTSHYGTVVVSLKDTETGSERITEYKRHETLVEVHRVIVTLPDGGTSGMGLNDFEFTSNRKGSGESVLQVVFDGEITLGKQGSIIIDSPYAINHHVSKGMRVKGREAYARDIGNWDEKIDLIVDPLYGTHRDFTPGEKRSIEAVTKLTISDLTPGQTSVVTLKYFFVLGGGGDDEDGKYSEISFEVTP